MLIFDSTWMQRLLAVFSIVFLLTFPEVCAAVEAKRFSELRPNAEQTLQFEITGTIPSETVFGRFILGGWPRHATHAPPHVPPNLTVLQGMQEDGLWSNAFLLRLEPAPYLWLSNLSAHAASRYDSIGSGRILVSFDQPICSVGVVYAQTGAHNPHHPDLRRQTNFYFYAEDGSLIDRFGQKPGHFVVQTAFGKELSDPSIWALSIDSEVSFAVIDLVAMECAIPTG